MTRMIALDNILVNKPGISLLTGNIFGGHVWFRIAGPQMVVDMLKSMAFDVMTLGIQEFHNGPRGLVPLFSDADLTTKIVLCNVDFSRDHVLSKLPNLPTRSTILTVDNLKVGIVGYVSNLVRVMGQPGVTIVINDPMESLRNESKRLRGEGCHVVFAIGGGDSNEDRTLADSLTDITAFVVKYQGRFAYPSTATEKHGLNFGQDLDYPINFTRSTDGKMAYIFASTNHFQLLSKFQMTMQVRSMSIVSAIGTPIILDLQAPEDRKTRELMDRYTKIIEPKAREVIGTTKVYIDNRKEVCQTGECNGGNLLADAAFDYFSEVAVAGELRLEDVFQMYPYNDQYMFVTMRGTTLQNMMEYSGRRAPPYSKFLQLSGIRVKYKANPGVNESTVSSLLILCTSCRTPTYERVIGIQWYTLAMSRYLANGGDGYDFTRVPRGYKVSSS
ncbi:protein 5NUC [Rhipicephalus sanguineus]|uniref:protein 5NUC n=1 Tax=Rhipicephalus sanguineus TaxID=34632 RepID=UPI0020C20EFA|nr:protein 5NUC [Rhipicephalus sanguineus]